MSIENSKNTISNSSITAGGDVFIGDVVININSFNEFERLKESIKELNSSLNNCAKLLKYTKNHIEDLKKDLLVNADQILEEETEKEALEAEYIILKEKLDKACVDEEQFKTSILQLAKIFSRIDVNDEQLVKALNLFQHGKLQEANEVLSFNKLKADTNALQKAREQKKNELDQINRSINITSQSFLVKAQLLLLNFNNVSRFEEAEQCFQESINLYCNFENSFSYAKYLYHQHQYSRALSYYEIALEYQKSKYEEALAIKGKAKVYSSKNDYQTAIKEYSKVIIILENLVNENFDDYGSLYASTYNDKASLYAKNNEYKLALDAYEIALRYYKKLAKDNSSEYNLNVAITLTNIGSVYSDMHNFKITEDYYAKAVKVFNSIDDKVSENYKSNLGILFNNLGVLYTSTKKTDLAIKSYLDALHLYLPLSEQNPKAYELKVALCSNNIGDCFYRLKHDFKQALVYLKMAMDICERLVLQDEHAFGSFLAQILNNIANAHRGNTDFESAQEFYNKALAIRRELITLNPHSYKFKVDLASTYSDSGNLYTLLNKYEIAKECHMQSFKIIEKFAASNSQEYQHLLAKSNIDLATAYSDLNDFHNALKYYKDGVDKWKELADLFPEAYEFDLAKALSGLGTLYFHAKQIDNHLELSYNAYQNALIIKERLFSMDKDSFGYTLAFSLCDIANIYSEINCHKDAIDNYKRALEIFECMAQRSPKTYRSDLGRTYNNLALAYLEIGELELSIQNYNLALEQRRSLSEENPAVYEVQLAKTLFSIANYYYRITDYEQSIFFGLKAKEIFVKYEKDFNQAKLYLNSTIKLLQTLGNE